MSLLRNTKGMIALEMSVKDKIRVSKDFHDKPGGRDKLEGENNGEDFLIRLLYPKFVKAIIYDYVLEVDLSNIYGYPSSFISGSFGSLSYRLGQQMGREQAVSLIKKHLRIVSEDNPLRAKETLREIEEPRTQKKQ